jgi:hemerythrin superfamily protein
MNLHLSEARERAEHTRDRLLDTGKDVYGQVAEVAGKAFAPGGWGQLAGAAAAGFVAGAAVLSARKVAMQATTAVAGDWFAQLKAEHRLAETLFDLILATREHETGKRHALFSKLTYALVKHQLEEENVVYPALREADQATAAKHLAAEHFDMKSYLHELNEMPKDDPRWLAQVRHFRRLVLDHVREEEEQVYPAFHGRLSPEHNAHITRAMNREGIKLA